ncbi:helix-turn-helix domain-containing protein [Mycobacterium sp. UM_Kg1]|uniref:helix-turn-helix domain-containing protein n=1 Tax=Mycobacterium sp. UM_Kg1 TaxID=1545691 RepID=UPI000B2F1342|nr:helix-turn-helix domain-containing protein [Mycobacterium sp. UM_Kg1]
MPVQTRLLVPIIAGPEGVSHALGGVGRTKVYELIRQGELTLAKIGRRSFVTSESIEAYVDRLVAAALAERDAWAHLGMSTGVNVGVGD